MNNMEISTGEGARARTHTGTGTGNSYKTYYFLFSVECIIILSIFFLGSRRVRYEKSIFGSSHKVAFDVRRANITRTNVCVFSLRIAIEKYCTEKRSIGWYANKLHHHHLVWQYSVL